MLGAIIGAVFAVLLIAGGVAAGVVVLVKEHKKLKQKDAELQTAFEKESKAMKDSVQSLTHKDAELQKVFEAEKKQMQDSLEKLDTGLKQSLSDTDKRLSNKDTELRKRIIGLEDQHAALTKDFTAESVTADIGSFNKGMVMGDNKPIVLHAASTKDVAEVNESAFQAYVGYQKAYGKTLLAGSDGGYLTSKDVAALHWGADGKVTLLDDAEVWGQMMIGGNLCIQDTCVSKEQLGKLLSTLKS